VEKIERKRASEGMEKPLISTSQPGLLSLVMVDIGGKGRKPYQGSLGGRV